MIVFFLSVLLATSFTLASDPYPLPDEKSLTNIYSSGRDLVHILSKYQDSQCFRTALDRLRTGCDEILKSTTMKQKLALLFSDCLQEANGLRRYPCMQEAAKPSMDDQSVKSCVQEVQVDMTLMTLYQSYFQQLDAMCYYYQADLWHTRTSSLIEALRDSAARAHLELGELAVGVTATAREIEQQAATQTKLSQQARVLQESVRDLTAQELEHAELSQSVQRDFMTMLLNATDQIEAVRVAQAAVSETIREVGSGLEELESDTQALRSMGAETLEEVGQLGVVLEKHTSLMKKALEMQEKLAQSQEALDTAMRMASEAAQAAAAQAHKASSSATEALTAQLEAAKLAHEAQENAEHERNETRSMLDNLLKQVRSTAAEVQTGNERIIATQSSILGSVDRLQGLLYTARARARKHSSATYWLSSLAAVSSVAFLAPALRVYWLMSVGLLLSGAVLESAASACLGLVAPGVIGAAVRAVRWLPWATLGGIALLDMLGTRPAVALVDALSGRHRALLRMENKFKSQIQEIERAVRRDDEFEELSSCDLVSDECVDNNAGN